MATFTKICSAIGSWISFGFLIALISVTILREYEVYNIPLIENGGNIDYYTHQFRNHTRYDCIGMYSCMQKLCELNHAQYGHSNLNWTVFYQNIWNDTCEFVAPIGSDPLTFVWGVIVLVGIMTLSSILIMAELNHLAIGTDIVLIIIFLIWIIMAKANIYEFAMDRQNVYISTTFDVIMNLYIPLGIALRVFIPR